MFAFPQKQTIITGRVSDASTNEAIPFANVYIKGTTLGTQTDFDGNYTFKVPPQHKVDSLTVQAIGYEKKTKPFKPGITQKIDFQLTPTTVQLSEVVVKPGENPAFRILREVWKRKDQYNLGRLDFYEYESYVKADISINQITDKFRNSRTMRQFARIFDSLKVKAGEDGQIVLPFFLSETVSDYYYVKFPEKKKEKIKASKVSGIFLDDGTLAQQFMGATFQNYNFYDNWLPLFDRQFISPIADFGTLYYRYYLVDSLFIDNQWCYKIDVKPRREQDLAFTGSIWITDTTFALKRLKIETTKYTNLNFINSFKIEVEYTPDTVSGVWYQSRIRTLIDAPQVGFEGVNFLAKFSISNKDFKANIRHEPEFYEYPIEIENDASLYDENYWREQRATRTNDKKDIEDSYAIIDSIRQAPRIKFWRESAIFLLNGYKRFGKVEAGHWVTLYGNNPVEGHRFQLNLRTNTKFSKDWVLRTYGAYGTKDQQFKYNFAIDRFISRKSWTRVGVEYTYDMERLGIDPAFLEEYQMINVLFSLNSQFGSLNKMGLNHNYKIWYESDIARNFTLKTILSHRDFNPQGDFNFAYLDDQKKIRTTYKTSELTFSLRWAPSEKFLVKENYRVSVDARRKPVYLFKFTMGLPGIFGSNLFYNKMSFNIQHKFKMGIFGKLFYNITATKVIGKVPYPLMVMYQGNPSPFSSERSYNMMDFFEFVSDQSIEGLFLNHFEGLIFNSIPLLRKLKLREVGGINIAWGSFSKENLSIYPETNLNGQPITTFKTLKSSEPYMEAFFGIENIFKVFRVMVFQRLTYLDGTMPRFGVRGSFFITM